jgi:hypothetical protein
MPVAINELETLFARVLASHRRGPGSISCRDMLISGALVEDGDDLFVKSLHRAKVTDHCVYKFRIFSQIRRNSQISFAVVLRIRITQIRIKTTESGSVLSRLVSESGAWNTDPDHVF